MASATCLGVVERMPPRKRGAAAGRGRGRKRKPRARTYSDDSDDDHVPVYQARTPRASARARQPVEPAHVQAVKRAALRGRTDGADVYDEGFGACPIPIVTDTVESCDRAVAVNSQFVLNMTKCAALRETLKENAAAWREHRYRMRQLKAVERMYGVFETCLEEQQPQKVHVSNNTHKDEQEHGSMNEAAMVGDESTNDTTSSSTTKEADEAGGTKDAVKKEGKQPQGDEEKGDEVNAAGAAGVAAITDKSDAPHGGKDVKPVTVSTDIPDDAEEDCGGRSAVAPQNGVGDDVKEKGAQAAGTLSREEGEGADMSDQGAGKDVMVNGESLSKEDHKEAHADQGTPVVLGKQKVEGSKGAGHVKYQEREAIASEVPPASAHGVPYHSDGVAPEGSTYTNKHHMTEKDVTTIRARLAALKASFASGDRVHEPDMLGLCVTMRGAQHVRSDLHFQPREAPRQAQERGVPISWVRLCEVVLRKRRDDVESDAKNRAAVGGSAWQDVTKYPALLVDVRTCVETYIEYMPRHLLKSADIQHALVVLDAHDDLAHRVLHQGVTMDEYQWLTSMALTSQMKHEVRQHWVASEREVPQRWRELQMRVNCM